MPALVTAPPVYLDIELAQFGTIANYGQDTNNQSGLGGAGTAGAPAYFLIGSKLYAVLSCVTATPGTGRSLVSLDKGLTWTGLDEPNEPGTAGGNNIATDIKVYYPGVGTVIYTQYRTNPGGGTVAFFNSFDTVTGLWSVNSAASAVNFIPAQYTFIVRLTSGDIYTFAATFPTGNNNVQYTKFSGGAWINTLVNVNAFIAGHTAVVKGAWADATDTMHVIYQATDGSTFYNLFYVQVSSTGLVGAPILLLTGAATERYNVFLLNGLWNSQLVICCQRKSDNITTVLLGTPTTAPVFTLVVVDPAASTVTLAAFSPGAVVTPGNQLAVFWYTNSTSNLDNRLWRNISTGPAAFANPPVWWYSEASNPPVGPVFEPVISNAPEAIGNPIAFPDGTFSILWDAVTADEFPSFAIGDSPLVTPITKVIIDAAGGGFAVQNLPTIGSVCKFARPTRPTVSPRVIQVGKTLTYPDWFVGGSI